MSKRKLTPSQQKAIPILQKLRKLGIYSPENSRKAPTKYALSVARKYKDVVEGKAEVIKVPKTKRSKGFKAAHEAAKQGPRFRAVRNILVVPKHEGETVTWDKNLKTFSIERWSNDFTTHYSRTPFGSKVTDPKTVKIDANQRISIPFSRGRGGDIEWMNLTYDQFQFDWQKYKIEGTYKTMGDHIFILTVEQDEEGEAAPKTKKAAKRRRKRKAKKSSKKK